MNLTDAKTYLTNLQQAAGSDVDDAKAARLLADEDLARFDRFHGNMIRMFGATGSGVTAIGRLRDRAQQRAQAATDRAHHADSTNGVAGSFISLLDQHLGIRERGLAAGGLAQRETYGAGTNPPNHQPN